MNKNIFHFLSHQSAIDPWQRSFDLTSENKSSRFFSIFTVEILSLIFFFFFLRDEISLTLLPFLIISAICFQQKLKLPSWLITTLGLALNFVLYLSFNTHLTTALGINLLLGVVVLKFFDHHTSRDRYISHLVVILLLLSGFLFRDDLPYFIGCLFFFYFLAKKIWPSEILGEAIKWKFFRQYLFFVICLLALYYSGQMDYGKEASGDQSTYLTNMSHDLFPRDLNFLSQGNFSKNNDLENDVIYWWPGPRLAKQLDDLWMKGVNGNKNASEPYQMPKVPWITCHSLEQTDGWQWYGALDSEVAFKKNKGDQLHQEVSILDPNSWQKFQFLGVAPSFCAHIGSDYIKIDSRTYQWPKLSAEKISFTKGRKDDRYHYEIYLNDKNLEKDFVIEKEDHWKAEKHEWTQKRQLNLISRKIKNNLRAQHNPGAQKHLNYSELLSLIKNYYDSQSFQIDEGSINNSMKEFVSSKKGSTFQYISVFAHVLRDLNVDVRLIYGFKANLNHIDQLNQLWNSTGRFIMFKKKHLSIFLQVKIKNLTNELVWHTIDPKDEVFFIPKASYSTTSFFEKNWQSVLRLYYFSLNQLKAMNTFFIYLFYQLDDVLKLKMQKMAKEVKALTPIKWTSSSDNIFSWMLGILTFLSGLQLIFNLREIKKNSSQNKNKNFNQRKTGKNKKLWLQVPWTLRWWLASKKNRFKKWMFWIYLRFFNIRSG